MENFKNLIERTQEFNVHQRHEMAELMGFETRNKYELLDTEQKTIGFAAEQNKGFFKFIARQFLGHWRAFDVILFDNQRQVVAKCHHPFRFFFNRLEITDPQGQLYGVLEQRFGILNKKFDLLDNNGRLLLNMSSSIFKIWTFKFFKNSRAVAIITKKWSGVFSEMFTDRDNFKVEVADQSIPYEEKVCLLAASIFIDLIYFEKKASK
ncbi:MAG: phospholipid scramblase-related protein [Bdellovibrionales bacterium]